MGTRSLLIEILVLKCKTMNTQNSGIRTSAFIVQMFYKTPWQARTIKTPDVGDGTKENGHEQPRKEIMGQDAETKQAIKNTSMRGVQPDVVWGEMKRRVEHVRTPLCCKQRIMPWLGFTCI